MPLHAETADSTGAALSPRVRKRFAHVHALFKSLQQAHEAAHIDEVELAQQALLRYFGIIGKVTPRFIKLLSAIITEEDIATQKGFPFFEVFLVLKIFRKYILMNYSKQSELILPAFRMLNDYIACLHPDVDESITESSILFDAEEKKMEIKLLGHPIDALIQRVERIAEDARVNVAEHIDFLEDEGCTLVASTFEKNAISYAIDQNPLLVIMNLTLSDESIIHTDFTTRQALCYEHRAIYDALHSYGYRRVQLVNMLDSYKKDFQSDFQFQLARQNVLLLWLQIVTHHPQQQFTGTEDAALIHHFFGGSEQGGLDPIINVKPQNRSWLRFCGHIYAVETEGPWRRMRDLHAQRICQFDFKEQEINARCQQLEASRNQFYFSEFITYYFGILPTGFMTSAAYILTGQVKIVKQEAEAAANAIRKCC